MAARPSGTRGEAAFALACARALRCFRCTAAWGHRSADNDIRRSHLGGPGIPAEVAGDGPGQEKSPAPPPRSAELLMPPVMIAERR